MTKHMKETCFQVIGYPEWWEDCHKLNRNQTAKGRSAIGKEGDEGGDRFVAPAGNHETVGAEVGGCRPADAPAVASNWWATGQAEGKKEEAARAHFAQFGGYPDGDDHWVWH
ncbi:uncharacterized protein LOC121793725 [Salvia splendens]|uniref:uncharacterized protein LOC121793725 n=1 Tax=Salvia splendens TaxID=180675 RepID=UPI001C268990|nr:uncharacterized protein LOC121793725 [Salvia splendens]